MAGIGEASAIVGVLQVGFSLATTLNTYISDVSDAGDDITSLVSDIEATFSQLRDLGKLIEKNQTTKAWSEDGLHNAKKCVTDCEKIITKLRKLLKKATASASSKEVNRDEIDVSKLERALWPFIKPQLEVRRRELQSIKQDIMIAYTSYMTQIGTDAQRKKYTEDLPRLQRTRALARRQVREAKEYRHRQISNRPREPYHRPSVQLPPGDMPPPPLEYDGYHDRYQGYTPGANRGDDGHDAGLDEKEILVFDNVDELECEFEAWKVEEEERKREEGEMRKMIQEEAVKTYREQQLREVEARRKKVEDERSSLRAELQKQRVAPLQIEDIINHMHPQQQINSNLHLLNPTPASDTASSVVSGDGPAKAKSSHWWSIWSRKKSKSSLSSIGSTLVNEGRSTPIPDILKDSTAEGGIAPLEANYFQRSSRMPHIVQNFQVEIPDQWLLDSLIKRQEAVAHDPKKVNSVWREFSQLPDDYRHSISKHIRDKSELSYNSIHATWVLLHLECMFEKRRRGKFDGGSRGEVVGVYLVLKKHKKPRDRSSEPESSERTNGFNKNVREEIVIRHNEEDHEPQGPYRPSPRYSMQHSPMRRRSDRTTYVPAYPRMASSSNRRARPISYNHAYQGVVIDNAYPETRERERNSTHHVGSYWPAPSPGAPRPFPPLGVNSMSYGNWLEPRSRPIPNEQLYDTDYSVPYRRHPSPRRSRSRSRSPKPLRRSATDESYRSDDSMAAPSQGMWPAVSFREMPERPDRLSTIQEITEGSDGSTSSEDSDDGVIPRRLRRQARETDEELLQKTLKEYVNPPVLLRSNTSRELPILATASEGEPSAAAVRDEDPSTRAQAQPSVEEVQDVDP